MRTRKHSRAGLFLIELMIAIAFFAVTAAVFLQAFARADSISRQAEDLFQAQKQVSSVAEILEGAGSASVLTTGQEESGTDAGTGSPSEGRHFFQKLQKYFPQMESTGDGACMYYDEDWEVCGSADGVYVMSVVWQRDGQMWDVTIAADKNAGQGENAGENDVDGQEKNSGRTAVGSRQPDAGSAAGDSSIYQLTLKLYDPDAEGGSL